MPDKYEFPEWLRDEKEPHKIDRLWWVLGWFALFVLLGVMAS